MPRSTATRPTVHTVSAVGEPPTAELEKRTSLLVRWPTIPLLSTQLAPCCSAPGGPKKGCSGTRSPQLVQNFDSAVNTAPHMPQVFPGIGGSIPVPSESIEPERPRRAAIAAPRWAGLDSTVTATG